MSGSSNPSSLGEPRFLEDENQLCDFLGSTEHTDEVVSTHLQASDRVIARVTDGIYREPASALRELISNAWDADASSVTILTDAPRFERIYVRDDGNGMTYQTLTYLVKNIGGSAKRSLKGQELGVTGSNDSDLSPGGRMLIGKVGIGLFSVSQLARKFRIITKVKGADYRLIAEVELRAYTEDDEDSQVEAESDDKYISGVVRIIRQKALDVDSHGTDLILEDIKPRVRDLLRDRDRWAAILSAQDAGSEAKGSLSSLAIKRPVYHSGYAHLGKAGEPTTLVVAANTPWGNDCDPSERMSQLMSAVEQESSKTDRPNLADTLDAYLEMLWTLGLSAPVSYVDGHPFDIQASTKLGLYWISNDQKGQASEILMHEGETVRQAVKRAAPRNPDLTDGIVSKSLPFKVFVDEVEIKRPIRFKFIAAGERSIHKSLLFVGKYHPDLAKVAPEKRGGSLEMEGYIFWNGRIIPKENNGVLIRIRGASGAIFDPTFFKYQVSELTRLRQLTSEIFIQRGLDAALNIDRESFNFSHPHVQLVALWLQRGIRQLTNKHKDIAADQRSRRLEASVAAANSEISAFVEEIWDSRQSEEGLPEVSIGSEKVVEDARLGGSIAFSSSRLFNSKSLKKASQEEREAKAKAITQVLLAFNLLQDMTFQEQEILVNALLQVFYGVERQ